MKLQTACFTGHRVIQKADLPLLVQRLDETITGLINRGVVCYISGAARGFDTLAALAVLRKRETNSAVKLILELPCRVQAEKWSKTDQQQYQSLLQTADNVVCLSEHYYDGCMAARNKSMIEKSSVCIAYMTHGRSGTSQTVRFANEQGLSVINLSKDLRM